MKAGALGIGGIVLVLPFNKAQCLAACFSESDVIKLESKSHAVPRCQDIELRGIDAILN